MDKKTIKEYRIWKAMKSRCYSPSNKHSYYQKDGIEVCDRWKNSYENFIADMGKMPTNDCSIERIDVSKNYCPENCKWIPMKEQPKNRRTSHIYELNGEKKCLRDWARVFGVEYTALRKRIVCKHQTLEFAINDMKKERKVYLNGEGHLISEWCKILNINSMCVYSRINRGWSKEEALTKDIEKIKLKEF